MSQPTTPPASDREAKLLNMATQFPEAPTAQFSLGKLYLESGRHVEAAERLARAAALDPAFAAAWVSLGDARAAAGDRSGAAEAWARARKLALEQGHPELAEEIDQRSQDE